MKKVGDLFEELGFRKEGSDSVKRAFIENLVKAANESAIERGQTPAQVATPVNVPRTTAKASTQAPVKTAKLPVNEQQLSFNFDEANGPETPFPLSTLTKRTAG